MESNGSSNTRDRLVDDLRLMIKDADDLLRSTGQHVDEGYKAARAKFESTLGSAKSSLTTLEERLSTDTREVIEHTDRYVKEHPWQSVGAGALAGLIVGLLIGRR